MFGFISLIIGVASAVSQRRQAKRAEAADREARNIQTASETVSNRAARRRSARDERIRRARVRQAASSSGVSGSSGELGALGAISGSTAIAMADQQANILATSGINRQLQIGASARSRGKQIAALSNLAQDTISGFKEGAFDAN